MTGVGTNGQVCCREANCCSVSMSETAVVFTSSVAVASLITGGLIGRSGTAATAGGVTIILWVLAAAAGVEENIQAVPDRWASARKRWIVSSSFHAHLVFLFFSWKMRPYCFRRFAMRLPCFVPTRGYQEQRLGALVALTTEEVDVMVRELRRNTKSAEARMGQDDGGPPLQL